MKEVFVFPTKSNDMLELQDILKSMYKKEEITKVDCAMLGSHTSRNRLVQLPLKVLILENAIEWGAEDVAKFVEFKSRSSEHITILGISTFDDLKEFCHYAFKLGINVSMLNFKETVEFLEASKGVSDEMAKLDAKTENRPLLSWEEF